MIRELYNVRTVPPERATTTPLTPDEERRCRATLFTELGNEIADRGWVRFPAHSREERARLVDVGRMLSEHWGMTVTVEAEDECALRLSLAGHALRP